MALDFPNSPTNGQIFGAYTWNSARGVWLQTSMSSRVVTTSDTPPASPTNGDMWMYTVDGTCFIYYNDGTSGQWVEQSKSILTPATYQSPNYIINGAFDIWQRGTSSTGVGYGSVDRFLHSFAAGTATISRSTDVPSNEFVYSLSFASTSGTNPFICQRIESANSVNIAGKTVTLSIWAKSTVGTGPLIWDSAYPTATDNWTSETYDTGGTFAATMTVGTWTRYSATFTPNVLATRGYRLNIYRNVTTTSTTTLYTGVQLENGSIATPFRRNAPSIQAELSACQRYYYRINGVGSGSYLAHGAFSSSTNGTFIVPFPSQMRVAPATIDFPTPLATYFYALDWAGAAGNTISALSTSQSTTVLGRLNFTTTGGTTNAPCVFRQIAAGAYIGFSAEL